MLGILAAATVVLAPAPPAPPAPDVRGRSIERLFEPRARDHRCQGAGRLQTSLAEPALLYREQDRDAGRARRLIDLPMGEMCLLDAAGDGQGLNR